MANLNTEMRKQNKGKGKTSLSEIRVISVLVRVTGKDRDIKEPKVVSI